MFLTTLIALVLWQEPARQATAVQQMATTAAPTNPEPPQTANQTSPRESVICERRAPTGSTLTRRICRTASQNQADADRARYNVGEITRGVSTQPLDPGPIVRP